jgi:hypothetical protein
MWNWKWKAISDFDISGLTTTLAICILLLQSQPEKFSDIGYKFWNLEAYDSENFRS